MRGRGLKFEKLIFYSKMNFIHSNMCHQFVMLIGNDTPNVFQLSKAVLFA